MVSVAPLISIRRKAMSRSTAKREPNGIDGHVDLETGRQQVQHRLLDTDVRLDSDDQDLVDPSVPPLFEELVAFAAAEHRAWTESRPVARPARRVVGPNPLGYCSVASTGMPRIRAPSIRRPMFHTSVGGGDMASSSFVWTSTTSNAESWRDMSSGLRAATAFSLFSLMQARIPDGGKPRQAVVRRTCEPLERTALIRHNEGQ